MVAPLGLVANLPRVALPYGLFSVLSLRPDSDRWQSGVTWESITNDDVESLGAAAPHSVDPSNGVPITGEATPFTVYGMFQASPAAYSPQDAQAKALEHLLAREEQKVEALLWSGAESNEPSLAAATTTVVTAGTDAAASLAALENTVAVQHGNLGVFHMTRGTALQLLGQQLLTVRGGGLYTQVGTPVVAGGGYPGTGPVTDPATDDADATGWVYATPPLFGYRSEPFPSSAVPGDLLDTRNNDLFSVVERTYVVGFDPCGVYAVLVG